MSSLPSVVKSSIAAALQTWHEFPSQILYLATACSELNVLPQCQMALFLALVLLGSLRHREQKNTTSTAKDELGFPLCVP